MSVKAYFCRYQELATLEIRGAFSVLLLLNDFWTAVGSPRVARTKVVEVTRLQSFFGQFQCNEVFSEGLGSSGALGRDSPIGPTLFSERVSRVAGSVRIWSAIDFGIG